MNGKPSILITGGYGNLGSWLNDYFSNNGYNVTILSHREHKLEKQKNNIIFADISDFSKLESKLVGDFEYCIHTASYNEHFHKDYSEKALMVNSLGTRNLIEILRKTSIKNFIYLSTFHIYGDGYDHINECCPPLPKNDYASTHLFAEYYLKQFYLTDNFPSIICRLTNSYGAPKSIDSTKWYLVLNDLVKSAYETGVIELSSNGNSSRDFVWIGDVCKVIEALLPVKADSEVYNISSGQSYKVIELAEMVCDVFEKLYNKNIEIIINYSDTSVYRQVDVDNTKLLNVIKHVFSNEINNEIVKIIYLLENSVE